MGSVIAAKDAPLCPCRRRLARRGASPWPPPIGSRFARASGPPWRPRAGLDWRGRLRSHSTPISQGTTGMYEQLALYIDGEFISGEGRRTQDVINPATLEVLGQLPHATEADLDRALAAAQRAYDSWKKSSPMGRQAAGRSRG
ncbi:hypothetical protein G6F57_019491 [Rhizopus arrhizus]|nr:hypothetical protein G6F57_019491 [Rhizopus arrhizus]